MTKYMVAMNYRSLWLLFHSKMQIKVDDIYFVCKFSKVALHWSVSGKPVPELYDGLQ